jgi:hypothetical protein
MAHVDLPVLIAGFNAARERFEAAKPDSDGPFYSLFEALAWVGAIGDRCKAEERPRPPLLDGLYYARNVVLHQGADVLDWVLIPGAELGMLVFGVSALGSTSRHTWEWPALAAMPEPRSPAGKAEYQALVAGREVTRVLNSLAQALDRPEATEAPGDARSSAR